MPDETTDRRFMPDKVRRPHSDLLQAVEQITAFGHTVAGSYRRLKPTVGDLDILIPPALDFGTEIEVYNTWFDYQPIRQGGMKSEGIAQYHGTPLLINLWRVPSPRAWAGLLLFATGPYDLNIAMRARAKSRSLLLSQYGLFRAEEKGQDLMPQEQLDSGSDEEEIFRLLDYEYLTPPEREDWRKQIRIKIPTRRHIFC